MFFNEVVGKKNKHKNRKAIWFEYMLRCPAPSVEIHAFATNIFVLCTKYYLTGVDRIPHLIKLSFQDAALH